MVSFSGTTRQLGRPSPLILSTTTTSALVDITGSLTKSHANLVSCLTSCQPILGVHPRQLIVLLDGTQIQNSPMSVTDLSEVLCGKRHFKTASWTVQVEILLAVSDKEQSFIEAGRTFVPPVSHVLSALPR